LTLRFAVDGAERVSSALPDDEISAVAALFRLHDRPGARLTSAELRPMAALLVEAGSIGGIARRFGGAAMKPV
jgi:hypothetical protein